MHTKSHSRASLDMGGAHVVWRIVTTILHTTCEDRSYHETDTLPNRIFTACSAEQFYLLLQHKNQALASTAAASTCKAATCVHSCTKCATKMACRVGSSHYALIESCCRWTAAGQKGTAYAQQPLVCIAVPKLPQ
jgi:hypothetical protein